MITERIRGIIIRFFGLKGSWAWACRQMERGMIIRHAHASGDLKYKLDTEDQGRILWAFVHFPASRDWTSANMFLSDFKATDYCTWA